MDFQYYLHTYLPTFVFLTLVKRIFSIFFGFSLVFFKKKISCFFNLRHWNSVGVYKRIVFCLKVSLSLSEVHPHWLTRELECFISIQDLSVIQFSLDFAVLQSVSRCIFLVQNYPCEKISSLSFFWCFSLEKLFDVSFDILLSEWKFCFYLIVCVRYLLFLLFFPVLFIHLFPFKRLLNLFTFFCLSLS